MEIQRVKKLIKGFFNPNKSVAQIRCALNNFGDIMTFKAIQEMLWELTIITFWSSGAKMQFFDSILGLDKLFKYSSLGGGTLIFAPRSSGWLTDLEFIIARTIPLFTFGTGVIDPNFIDHLNEISGKKNLIDKSNIDEWITCLKKFRLVSVRGVESQMLLRNVGFSNVEVVGDPGLWFSLDSIKERNIKKKIGINVSEYSHFWNNGQKKFIQKMTELLNILLKDNWEITFFPTMFEDVCTSQGVASNLNSGENIIYENYYDVKDYLKKLEDQDLFVGVKLHSVIAACCAYTPAIMIGYQPKCYDFMKTMGLEDHFFRSDRFEVDEIYGKINLMYKDIATIQKKQFEACKLFKERLQNFGDRIMETVTGC